jgi:hypothetical protein
MISSFLLIRLRGPGRKNSWWLPVAALLVGGLFVSSVLADSKIEGYYEGVFAMTETDRIWQFGQWGRREPGWTQMPQHYAELTFLTWPEDNFEAFFRMRAESSRDFGNTPEVEFYTPPWLTAEGHLKFQGQKHEAFLFSRQNRYWINDEPLLGLVSDWKLKNDGWRVPQAQGIRLDFWETELLGIKNLGGTFIFSDNGGTFPLLDENGNFLKNIPVGETAWIGRLRHKAFDNRLESAVMYLRKDWTNTGPTNYRDLLDLMYNEVLSADVAFSPRDLFNGPFTLGPVNLDQSRWTAEIAFSKRPFDEEFFGESTHNARAMATEIRDIQVGDLSLYAWYFDFGENFRDYLSGRFDDDREFNRIQKHLEAIWLVPRKAITAKVYYDYQRKRIRDEPTGGLRPAREWYGELYIEFIKGFKGKVAYKNWRGFDASSEVNDFFTYPNWFAEMSVENFLAKIRIQARLKDAGTFRELTAYGFDMNVNITERLKGYLRMLNVNEELRARHTLFAELKYDLGFGAEFFFQYGDPGQSDNLVNTDWFVSEQVNQNLDENYKLRNRIQLLLKAWFN